MATNNSVRDLTVERMLEAEYKSDQCGDNEIPFLRVEPNALVPPEYKVSVNELPLSTYIELLTFIVVFLGCNFTLLSNS